MSFSLMTKADHSIHCLSGSRDRWLVLALSVYMVSTLTSMAVMSLGAFFLLSLSLWVYGGPRSLFATIRESLKENYLRRYFQISLVLAISLTISLIWAKFFPVGYGGKWIQADLVPAFAKFWYLFWPLFLTPVLERVSEKNRLNILRAWIIAFFIFSLIGIFQYFTGWPRPQVIPGHVVGGYLRYHATIFLGHHLSVASIFIFPFFMILDFLRDQNKRRALGFSTVFLSLAVAVGAMTLFLTFSRTLWIALPIGILAWLVWNLPRRWAVVFTLLSMLGVFLASQHPVIQKRFQDGFGLSTRQELWKANWEFFKQRPLVGVGWRQNQELSGIYFGYLYPGKKHFRGHAHNNLIDMLAGTGLFGALSWLVWCLAVFWILWPSARRGDSFARSLTCAWLVFQINGMTQLNFWEGKVTHQAMTMMAWALLWARKSK